MDEYFKKLVELDQQELEAIRNKDTNKVLAINEERQALNQAKTIYRSAWIAWKQERGEDCAWGGDEI